MNSLTDPHTHRSRRGRAAPRASLAALMVMTALLVQAAPRAGADLYFTGYQPTVTALQTASGEAGLTGAALASAGGARAPEPSGGTVSRKKAIGASLLIPGWGQYLTGHHTRAKAFVVAEIAILASYAVFEVQGKVRQNRYIDYAEQFAGIPDASGKEDYYYRNLGVYRNSDDYIESIRQTARALYGDDIEAREAYVQRYSPPASERWAWQSDAQRLDYREQREDSRNSYRLASNMLGVALLNRVVSAVDAALSAGGSSRPQKVYLEAAGDGTQYVGVQVPLN